MAVHFVYLFIVRKRGKGLLIRRSLQSNKILIYSCQTLRRTKRMATGPSGQLGLTSPASDRLSPRLFRKRLHRQEAHICIKQVLSAERRRASTRRINNSNSDNAMHYSAIFSAMNATYSAGFRAICPATAVSQRRSRASARERPRVYLIKV